MSTKQPNPIPPPQAPPLAPNGRPAVSPPPPPRSKRIRGCLVASGCAGVDAHEVIELRPLGCKPIPVWYGVIGYQHNGKVALSDILVRIHLPLLTREAAIQEAGELLQDILAREPGTGGGAQP